MSDWLDDDTQPVESVTWPTQLQFRQPPLQPPPTPIKSERLTKRDPAWFTFALVLIMVAAVVYALLVLLKII